MANETTATTLTELFVEIKAEAQFVAGEKSIMKGLVKNYSISGGGKVLEVPIYAAVTAAAVAEATDLSNTAITPTSKSITAAEVGVMTTLTDMGKNSSPRNVAADIGKLFGNAIALKQDADLTALFDGFATSVGGATVAFTAPLLFEAAANLRTLGLDLNECAIVVHPKIAYDLKSSLSGSFVGLSTDVSNEAMRSGYVGKIAGVDMYESSNMVIKAAATGDYTGGMFHKDALALATMQDIKIEGQRDASLRADEIVATAVYGVGEIHDTYGVELYNDSSIVA